MDVKWDPTINLGNVLTAVPILIILFKMYGDWRVIKEKIEILWRNYLEINGLGHLIQQPKRRLYERGTK